MTEPTKPQKKATSTLLTCSFIKDGKGGDDLVLYDNSTPVKPVDSKNEPITLTGNKAAALVTDKDGKTEWRVFEHHLLAMNELEHLLNTPGINGFPIVVTAKDTYVWLSGYRVKKFSPSQADELKKFAFLSRYLGVNPLRPPPVWLCLVTQETDGKPIQYVTKFKEGCTYDAWDDAKAAGLVT
jgi:hypothetical protein